MILRLVLPSIDKVVDRAHLDRWLVELDEFIDYGDPVCVVRVDRIRTNDRSKGGRSLLQRVRRDADRSGAGVAHRSVHAEVLVVASDAGYLRRRDAAPGEPVVEGDLIGLVSTEPDEPLDCDSHDPRFRLVSEISLSPTDG